MSAGSVQYVKDESLIILYNQLISSDPSETSHTILQLMQRYIYRSAYAASSFVVIGVIIIILSISLTTTGQTERGRS